MKKVLAISIALLVAVLFTACSKTETSVSSQDSSGAITSPFEQVSSSIIADETNSQTGQNPKSITSQPALSKAGNYTYEGFVESIGNNQFTIGELSVESTGDFDAVGIDAQSITISYTKDTIFTVALSNNATETTEKNPGTANDLAQGKYAKVEGKEVGGIVHATHILIIQTVG